MKKTEAVKDVGHYMALPYTIILRPDEDSDIVAQIRELPGCIAHGQDVNEALEVLKDFQQAWIERRIESGQPVPEPEEEEDLPSGKWVQRVPRSLHRRLSQMAKEENISLNQLVTIMLSKAVESKATSRDWGTVLERLFGAQLMAVGGAIRGDPYDLRRIPTTAWVMLGQRDQGEARQSLPNIHKLIGSWQEGTVANAFARTAKHVYAHKTEI